MRQFYKTILLAMPMVLAAVTVSCTKQEDNNNGGDNPTPIEKLAYLRINSVSTAELSKAAIEGTSFPADEEISIGLFLEGEGYTDTYKNVKYTRKAGESVWTPETQIALTDKAATVYAYYPYEAGVTDIKEIKVTSSFDGKDFMWATPVEGVNAANPDIDLSFHHALALVEITFNIYGFDQESAKMTYLKIESTEEGFTAWGVLNATNGTLSPRDVEVLSTDNSFSVSSSRIVVPCLLVPINAGTYANPPRDFKVTCTFNSKTLSASLDGDNGVIIKQGTKSTISLNIKDGESKMEVVSVGVEPWKTQVSGNTATVDGHTVTFNCPEGLKYELNVENQTSTVIGETAEINQNTAVIFRYDTSSIPDSRFVFNNSVSGCTLTSDEQNGIITVTAITDNVTVYINYGTYIRYTASFQVVPNSKSAFGSPYDESRSTFSEDTHSGVVAIDGIVTSIGKQAFSTTNLTGIILPKELETIGESAFDGCKYLTSVNLQACDKLKTIGKQAFYGVGKNSESDPFALVLPEGLEEIGASAFGAAYISSVTLPSTLKEIGNNGFYLCENLKTITSKASNPPTLGEYVFHHYILEPSYDIVPLENIETIYVPAGSVDAYKAAESWSIFSSKITAIPSQD